MSLEIMTCQKTFGRPENHPDFIEVSTHPKMDKVELRVAELQNAEDLLRETVQF